LWDELTLWVIIMRATIAVLIIVLFLFQVTPKPDMTSRQIDLINNLGQISLLVPSNMDTFCTWVNTSDYDCGDKQQFRYSNSDYDLLLEAAYNFFEVPDSMYQLTVAQPKYDKCKDYFKITIDNDFLEDWKALELINNPKTEILFADLEEFNDRQFAVMAERESMNGMNEISLIAFTVIEGQLVSLGYTCYASNCDGFIDDMKESLRTIKITSPNTNHE
jgi:hypothetical protein